MRTIVIQFSENIIVHIETNTFETVKHRVRYISSPFDLYLLNKEPESTKDLDV